MSSLSAGLDLGASDLDQITFRELIFAHFREKYGTMTSSTSTATPLKHAFEARVAEIKSPKSDINALILDYLTMEGYPKAAAKFSKEANLQPQQEDPSIRARQEIQNNIHTGNIEAAISALNELDPEILDKDPQLHFSLLRLQLVELIRQSNGGDISDVLSFATRKLAPRAAMNSDFLQDLEKTMALLIFPHDSLQPELAALLRSDLRRQTATKVNEAVLLRQTERREAAIRHLVKMRAWAESTARSKKKDLPDRIELGLNGEDNDDHDENELMITT
ncbi:CTLH/CRA C-terminal to lish motif domain-containing protein [Diplogelasinospora grovesii]|uniref:CTLH/CRA C-terminal to lish motif domain-containing protein n=1 Tax=Diplogelasinospora grovesii TaxID=303347 RepID=A0AAN6N6M2_9PEZI|nr:CTLH/CRA C-terminal to lish motif domain-containing protein [Diplogelasinospora grovesii]